MKRLPRSFYARDTQLVAKDLLGKLLVRSHRGKKLVARITETEAYVGEDDLASHARFGKTKRNAVIYGQAGHAYIYFIYGMYDMLNIVTDEKDFPAAVLIRRTGEFDGPGKLTRALHITRALNGEDVVTSGKLYLLDDGFRVKKKDILTSPRIGVAYAGKHAKLPWRYYLWVKKLVSEGV